MRIFEKLLFAVHRGETAGHKAGIIMQDHCLPIACSHAECGERNAPVAEQGLAVCWYLYVIADCEQFFEAIGLTGGIESPDPKDTEPQGLYVYEVDYDDSLIEAYKEGWIGENCEDEQDAEVPPEWTPHLAGGTLRRPTLDELEPLTRGQAPWGGIVL
jgi:hypothetical protein